MKTKSILSILLFFMPILFVGANTYYLQKDMSTEEGNQSPLLPSIWYDQRTDGGNHPEVFTGSNFVVNGMAWRTPNTPRTSRFPGRIVVDAAGAGTGELLAAVWRPNALRIDAPALLRLRQPEVILKTETLEIGPEGILTLRAHGDGSRHLVLLAEVFKGSGTIELGRFLQTDQEATWQLHFSEGSDFSGEIGLVYGALKVEQDLNLPSATLQIYSANDVICHLDHGVKLTVGKVTTEDGRRLKSGVYKADSEDAPAWLKGWGQLIVLNED